MTYKAAIIRVANRIFPADDLQALVWGSRVVFRGHRTFGKILATG
jgi:hypothetical protein